MTQRHLLGGLFSALTMGFAAVAVGSAWGAGGNLGRWVVTLAAGAMAAWLASLAWGALRPRRRRT
jgi:hypothetical protein